MRPNSAWMALSIFPTRSNNTIHRSLRSWRHLLGSWVFAWMPWCFPYWFDKKNIYFRLLYQGQERYFSTVLGTLGFPSTTTPNPIILNHRSCKSISKNHAKSHLQQPIIHYQAQRMGVVSISITHACPPLLSKDLAFNNFFKKLICVKVSEDPLSETSFEIQEAFQRLLCNNFNTDRVSMFIVLQQNAPI